MSMLPFQLQEEIILKPGTRQCSGRFRDGKILYYLPKRMKKESIQHVLTDLRQNLISRLEEAYKYYDYFRQNQSLLNKSSDLERMAKEIYSRKYLPMDFQFSIQFRRQKTVLGTYRRKKDGSVLIYINDLLKNAPTFLLEYVIAHELSHHHYTGHDKAFYNELSQLCPDADERRLLANQYIILKEAELL